MSGNDMQDCGKVPCTIESQLNSSFTILRGDLSFHDRVHLHILTFKVITVTGTNSEIAFGNLATHTNREM